MNSADLIEALASKEHESWARWMAYVFACALSNADGSVTIPPDLAARWKRQISTPYADLSESEKQSDRNEVLHVLPLLHMDELREFVRIVAEDWYVYGEKYEVCFYCDATYPDIDQYHSDDCPVPGAKQMLAAME